MTDEFQGESGLKEDWDGTIVSAAFEQQGRGNWALVLHSLADDGEEVDHRPLSVGGADKGWTSHDGGEEIMGATEKQRFHERSSIQKFINAAMKSGAEEELRRRSRESFNSRGPMFSALWVGLRFHWDIVTKTEERQNQVSKEWEPTEISVMEPTKFLGVADGSPKAPTQPSSTQSSPSTTLSVSATGTNGDISDADMRALKLIAMSHEEWGEFADAVMAGTDASGEPFTKNPAIRKSLSKKDWYESLRV